MHLLFSGTCFLRNTVTDTIISHELENGKLLCLRISVRNQDSGTKPANSKPKLGIKTNFSIAHALLRLTPRIISFIIIPGTFSILKTM